MKNNIVTLTLPDWTIPPLIMDDFTNITDDEIKEIKTLKKYFHSFSNIGKHSFSWYNDMPGISQCIGHNCTKFTCIPRTKTALKQYRHTPIQWD